MFSMMGRPENRNTMAAQTGPKIIIGIPLKDPSTSRTRAKRIPIRLSIPISINFYLHINIFSQFYRTRQGFLESYLHPGIRYCMAMASSRSWLSI